MTRLCLLGFIFLSFLMYKFVILRLKVVRSYWLDAVRLIPLKCMGEKNTVLMLTQEAILENIIHDENFRLDMPLDKKVGFLQKLRQQHKIKINGHQREMGGYNGLLAIRDNFGITRTVRGDWNKK